MNTTVEQNKLAAYEAYYDSEFSRLWQDETTWVAESLNAPLHKDLEYHLENGQLVSYEGVVLKKVFDDSVEDYRILADIHPEFTFQYRRSLIEKKEFEKMQAMARGEGSNTLVVVSTYPDELKGARQDFLGYQHKRQLGFIRVIKRLETGKLAMWTHSFDGNHHEAIAAMYAHMDRTVDWSRDVLGQVVELNLAAMDQELLGDRLLYEYDKTLHEIQGGNWFAGRSEEDRRESISFAESQSDLVTEHVRAMVSHGKKPGFKSTQRYNFAMAMRRRFEGRRVVAPSASAEMGGAGEDGRYRGEIASGCGETVNAPTTAQQLNEAGYSMNNNERMIDVCMTCPACKKSRGVLVEKIGTDVFYTCQNKQCKATTKPTFATQSKPRNIPADTSTGDIGKKAVAQQSTDMLLTMAYGEQAERVTRLVVGGTVESIIDRRTGEVMVDL